ncbi:MAG: TetR/AcrR family transcriptional regulator [Christensenellaceae bacterium]
METEKIRDEMSEKIIEAAEKIATGSGEVTVRKIMRALNVTNRVFYNRFHSVEEVLEIVYLKTVLKVRESIEAEYDGTEDYFDYVTNVVADTLIASYDIKMKFNGYVFKLDSVTASNYEWYMSRIKQLFSFALSKGLIRNVDVDSVSYAIWCFCRGYNADAVMRLPKDEAVKIFKYSFRLLLDGLKKQN